VSTAEVYTSRELATPLVVPNGQLIGRVSIGGRNLNLAGVTASVTIRFGRVDPTDAPTPSSISLELIDLADAHPINCGDLIEVDLIGAVPRFRGWVTDLAQPWDSDTGTLELIGSGNLARIYRRKIGNADWPQESWSARVARVFADAEWTAYTVQTGADNPLVASRLASETTLGAELENLATTASAAIVDLPDGSILVQAMTARQAITTPVLVLPPELVLFAPAWSQSLDVVNITDVSYGTIEDQHTVTSRNDSSVTRYGERSASVGSTFALAADATTFGAAMVNRRGFPHWLVPTIQLAGLITPAIGALVMLRDLPAGSPVGSQWQPVCEGWVDTLEGDAWLTMLQVSDPIRSGMTLPWRNLPSDLIWQAVAPACTWADSYDLNHLLGVS
jgi:hypothetical protein